MMKRGYGLKYIMTRKKLREIIKKCYWENCVEVCGHPIMGPKLIHEGVEIERIQYNYNVDSWYTNQIAKMRIEEKGCQYYIFPTPIEEIILKLLRYFKMQEPRRKYINKLELKYQESKG